MEIECKVTEYETNLNSKNNSTKHVIVRSVFAHGDKAEIVIDGIPHRFSIDELKSALDKCRLNSFGI